MIMAKRKERQQHIIDELRKQYHGEKASLNFQTSLELLIATILSAQCTDRQVNIVTAKLFKKYPDVHAYAHANVAEMEEAVRSTGFYRNKAKNIIATAQRLMETHNGRVPQTMEELVSLPGVARKTANIVLSNAFFKNQGIAVDTHVKRLSQRLGLSKETDPNKIEQDLMALVPQLEWGEVNHWLVAHGREVCTARNPQCDKCMLVQWCAAASR